MALLTEESQLVRAEGDGAEQVELCRGGALTAPGQSRTEEIDVCTSALRSTRQQTRDSFLLVREYAL